MTRRYNWMDPNDVEVKSCSICEEEIYGMGSNPQPVIHKRMSSAYHIMTRS